KGIARLLDTAASGQMISGVVTSCRDGGVILRGRPKLPKEEPTNGTGDDGREIHRHAGFVQKVDQDFHCEEHQERQRRAEQNDSRDDRYGPSWQTAHGAMSSVTLTEPSLARLGCRIVDGWPAAPRSAGTLNTTSAVSILWPPVHDEVRSAAVIRSRAQNGRKSA
ncbi:MAG TPA: hypothetical protein VJX94_08860, partial [Stellaceae bacterium]|nr:hypothetical protein [Stellaceae bacterium]